MDFYPFLNYVTSLCAGLGL